MEFLPIRPASRLGRDAGSAAPAERTEASPPCRLTIRGQPALHVRTGGIHENRFVLSFGGSSRLRRRALVLRRTAPGHSDRKSTRLNSSHSQISYAVFCLKKKKTTPTVRSSTRAMHTAPTHYYLRYKEICNNMSKITISMLTTRLYHTALAATGKA